MTMSVYSEETFRPVIDAVSEQTGETFDSEDPLAFSVDRYLTEAMVATIDGQAEARLSVHQQGWKHHEPEALHTSAQNMGFTWRGLLRGEDATVDVSIPNPDYFDRYLWPEVTERVIVNLHPTTQQVDTVQQALGRQPGVDAFKMVRVPGGGHFRAGDWVNGFANKAVLQADPSSSVFFASHDLWPYDHIQSWVNTPPAQCDAIACYARGLQDTFGSAIHATDKDRPEAIDRFAAAADDYNGYTRLMMAPFRIIEASKTDQTTLPPQELFGRTVDLLPLAAGKSQKPESEHQAHNIAFSRTILSRLGIVDRYATPDDIRRVNTQYVAHIAGMYLRLEDIASLPADTPRVQNKRRQIWQHAIDTYGATA
jgi:hypothetical protein